MLRWLGRRTDRAASDIGIEHFAEHRRNDQRRSRGTRIPHEFNEVIISNNVLVDNTYAVPGAKCTGPYSEVIATTIDKEFGIPAVAGASVTEIRGTLYNSTNIVAEQGGAT